MDQKPEAPDHLELRKSGKEFRIREFLSSRFRSCRLKSLYFHNIC
jgi:hypothetical protein